MRAIERLLLAEIRRRGPIPFSEVVEAALYDPEDGFYATGGSAGRRGDFLTSPEVGPLFGAVVARALDRWWAELGEPDPFVVVEAGAGPGTLARAVLAVTPACAPALRYVLVERSDRQRARHVDQLPIEQPAQAFAPDHVDDSDQAALPPDLPTGPIAVSLAELPRLPGPLVVLANELLDNLAFDLAERRGRTWWEVRVGADDEGPLTDALVPLDGAIAAELDRLAADASEGTRVPIQRAARSWLRDALDLARPAEGGRIVAFDYVTTTADLALRPQAEWLRTYRAHGRGTAPLEDLGLQDITAEVCVDQLALTAPPTSDRSQTDWLRAHAIDELVEEGRMTWHERAAVGDLGAIRARSRVTEADALLDPAGLGAFRVLEWAPETYDPKRSRRGSSV